MREAYYGQSGVPTLVIDGKPLATQGGGSVTDAQQILDGRLRPPLEERLVVPAVGRLEITAPLARGVVTAKVTVTDAAGGSGPVTVMLALVEKQVRYSGGNGIRFHPMVVRKLVAAGRITNGGFAGRQTLDLKTIVRETQTLYGEYVKNNPGAAMLVLPEIDPANLMLVAFMQDDTTKEVLQSAIAPVVVGGR
jgi:hypothetical protein